MFQVIDCSIASSAKTEIMYHRHAVSPISRLQPPSSGSSSVTARRCDEVL